MCRTEGPSAIYPVRSVATLIFNPIKSRELYIVNRSNRSNRSNRNIGCFPRLRLTLLIRLSNLLNVRGASFLEFTRVLDANQFFSSDFTGESVD